MENFQAMCIIVVFENHFVVDNFVDFDYQLKKHHNAIQVQTDFFTNIEIYRIPSKTSETKIMKNEIIWLKMKRKV